ncbi:hypothetical protein HispidOSU_001058 [Sigmodon hispidus]
MAYSWQADPNHIDPQEGGNDHQQFHYANQCFSSNQVRLGFDDLVEEINNKTSLSESQREESANFVPGAPNLGSEWQPIYGTHTRCLNDFTSQSPDISPSQVGKTSAIGFNPAVLPTYQIIDEGDSWRNLTEKYHDAKDPRFNAPTPSSTGLDKCNPERQSETEHQRHKCHIEFEGSILPPYSLYSMDSITQSKNKGSEDGYFTEPALMSSTDSHLPRAWEGTSLENTEPAGCCPIQICEVPQGSNKILASFCNKVRRIRETYCASDINSNSGRIWAIITAYPSQLFSDTKVIVNVSTNNSSQTLHLLPKANYLVKDLIAEILLLCANEHLSPKEYLLSICGSEEFLQMDYCLGNHKIFQKNKLAFHLHLQKSRDVPGKLARKSEDDHSPFHLNQLLNFTHIWKISRQCLSTVVKKYNFHVKHLLKNKGDLEKQHLSVVLSSAPNPFQPHVNNISEEVKNICRVLGGVETKPVSDAVKELNLLQKRQLLNSHQKSETSKKGFIEKVTAELSRSIYQLIAVYCSSFCTDFQPVHTPGGASCIYPGLHSHLSFTVSTLHNVPETWAHSSPQFCALSYQHLNVHKSDAILVSLSH